MSCVMSKPSPIESMAFWAASKLETLGAIAQIEGIDRAKKAKVEGYEQTITHWIKIKQSQVNTAKTQFLTE